MMPEISFETLILHVFDSSNGAVNVDFAVVQLTYLQLRRYLHLQDALRKLVDTVDPAVHHVRRRDAAVVFGWCDVLEDDDDLNITPIATAECDRPLFSARPADPRRGLAAALAVRDTSREFVHAGRNVPLPQHTQ